MGVRTAMCGKITRQSRWNLRPTVRLGQYRTKPRARKTHPGRCKSALEHLPEKIAETGVEGLIIDTTNHFVELVPMRLSMPYVHVWNILHIDRSGSSPACFFPWPYETTPEALARNVEGLKKFGGLYAPILAVAKSYAEKNELQIDWNDPTATVSKLAGITQTPKEFDFPISNWPPQFHYAGPFHDDEGREQVPFPWEKLTGAPLIYASLGTLVNGIEHVYRAILRGGWEISADSSCPFGGQEYRSR
jgi:zeaxanthin glucosyltransferase